MLYLKDTPINQILSMNEMIEAVEDTLKEVALGRGFELPRRRIHHPNRMIFGLLPGSVHGAMGAYLQTDLDRRIHHETVILYSVETGAPLILFQDCAINENRTAAAGAIGAKYLARADARRVALFGSAVHAESQLKAVAAVRDLTQVRVYSPTPKRRENLAVKARRELKISVRAASRALKKRWKTPISSSRRLIPRRRSLTADQLPEGSHITSIANGDKTQNAAGNR